MSTTVNNLLIGALRLINVVQSNETPAPDDMNIALQAFDAMIDSWANDPLMQFSVKEYIFNTVGGQLSYQMGPCKNIKTFGAITGGTGYVNGTYVNVPIISTTGTGVGASAVVVVSGEAITAITISKNLSGPGDDTTGGGYGYNVGDIVTVSNTQLGGFGSGFSTTVATTTGGDWALPRPMTIKQAYVIWNDPLSAQAVDLGMAKLNDAQWASIAVKNTPSNFPFAFYDDQSYPVKNIQVWPVPTQSTGIRFWLYEPLVDFTNLNTLVSYPNGYERAFRFNLACELAAEFGKDIPMKVQETADEAKGEIARLNSIPQYQVGDGGLANSRQAFNWITGGLVPWTRF